MSEKIEHGFISVKDVFDGKWYKIPEYQRPYVWEKEQVDTLLDDIMNEAENYKGLKVIEPSVKREYFLGSLVWKITVQNDNGMSYEEFEVLDGQQRLTTMLLIHAVIRDLTGNTKCKEACKKAIFQEENPYYETPERMRIVYGIRGNAERFIDEYVKKDGGTLLHDRLNKIAKTEKDINCAHMAEVILAIHEFFSENTQEKIDAFFGFFSVNTKVIYISSKELEDAFHLFNVMNNRGIKLRNSDILKAKNLSKIIDAGVREEYAEQWERMENYFGEDFDQFLEFIRLCIVKRKAAASLLKEFEDNIYNPTEYDRNSKTSKRLSPLLVEGKSTLECIKRYFDAYQAIFDNNAYSVSIQNTLMVMDYGIDAKFWKAAALHYYIKFGDGKFDRFMTLLNRKFTADWVDELYLTKRIENTCRIIEAIDAADDEDDLFKRDVFDYNKELTLAQLDSSIYGKKYCRYVLLLVSALMWGRNEPFPIPKIMSIEHILPQTPHQDSKWMRDFSEEQRDACTNRIGNLMLISRRKNSSLGNSDFEKKKEKYFYKNVECFPLSVWIYTHYQTWTYSDFETNHIDTLNKLKEYYEL